MEICSPAEIINHLSIVKTNKFFAIAFFPCIFTSSAPGSFQTGFLVCEPEGLDYYSVWQGLGLNQPLHQESRAGRTVHWNQGRAEKGTAFQGAWIRKGWSFSQGLLGRIWPSVQARMYFYKITSISFLFYHCPLFKEGQGDHYLKRISHSWF